MVSGKSLRNVTSFGDVAAEDDAVLEYFLTTEAVERVRPEAVTARAVALRPRDDARSTSVGASARLHPSERARLNQPMRAGQVILALATATLAACDGGDAPLLPSGASSGFELTPIEIMAGVSAADIAAAVYPPMDPRRYGASAADGGPNSDQAALQMAVDVAAVAGGAVELPAGTWNGCLTIAAPGVSLVGAGSTGLR